MTTQLTTPKTAFLKTLISGLLGMTLLLPASFFLLTLIARALFGVRSLYHYFSPSFLQSPFDLWAWHKAQFIILTLLLAIGLNALNHRRHWLNTAIMLQGTLMLLALTAYTVIQHIRY